MQYVFADWVLDTERRELRRAGVPVKIEPKVYQVLVYLVQHAERLVTQEALKIAQDVSDTHAISKQWLGLAYAYHHLGHLAAARRSYQEGLALEYPLTHYRCAILLGIFCLEEDQALEAQAHGTRGIDLCRALLDETPDLVRLLYSLALAYLGNRQPHEALATYQRALEVCSAPGVVRDALQVPLLRRIFLAVTKLDEVTQLLEAARGRITG